MRLAVRQHLRVLDDGRDKVVYHNAFQDAPRWLRHLAPDYVLFHPTFLGVRWNEDFARLRHQYAWLRDRACPKIALPQDEYDHSEVLEEWLAELGATQIFSCFGTAQRRLLYPKLNGAVPFTETLTGFIDEGAAAAIAAKMLPANHRPFDIVYRAAKLPYWFGSHGQLKHRLAAIVDEPARARGLRTDISTRWEDTIFGSRWLDFIMSGRATVGAESGSSVLDPRGEIQARIRRMLDDEPDLSFEEVDRRMPAGWDSYAFFAISPRHLEAVVTKTCQILVEGSYSGVLIPHRHYIPLRRDFSNLSDVLDRLGDVDACAEITDTAYREIFECKSFALPRLAEEVRRAAGGSRSHRHRLRTPVVVLRLLQPPPDGRARAAAAPTRVSKLLTTTRIWVTIARTVVAHPALGRLLARWPRRSPSPPLRRLAGDVLRLAVLERLRIETASGDAPWWISARVVDGVLELRSEFGPPDTSTLTVTEAFTRVVWDHSAVGNSASLVSWHARPDLRLGDDGRYSFDALAALGGIDTAVLERALRGFEPR